MSMVAVCEISMICVNATKLMTAAMIGCETTMLLRSHRIISSPFRRLALGFIIYFIFIEQCNFWRYGCRVDIRRFASCRFGRRCSACCHSGCRCSYHDKFRYGTITIYAYRIWKKWSWPVCKTYKSLLLPQISPNQVESTHTLSHDHCSKVGK